MLKGRDDCVSAQKTVQVNHTEKKVLQEIWKTLLLLLCRSSIRHREGRSGRCPLSQPVCVSFHTPSPQTSTVHPEPDVFAQIRWRTLIATLAMTCKRCWVRGATASYGIQQAEQANCCATEKRLCTAALQSIPRPERWSP